MKAVDNTLGNILSTLDVKAGQHYMDLLHERDRIKCEAYSNNQEANAIEARRKNK